MDRSLTKLTKIEAICFVVIIAVNHIILNQPHKVLSSMGSSSLLNTIYVSLIALIYVIVILKLFRNFFHSDIIDISEFVAGAPLKIAVGLLVLFYLILTVATSLRNFSDILYLTYYRFNHVIFILSFFLLLASISNFFGESAILKTNVIITLIVFISLGLNFALSIGNMIPQKIFPLLGFGFTNTFISGFTNLTAFNGLYLLYFIFPFLSEPKDYRKISFISVGITSALLFVSTACLLLSLPYNISDNTTAPIFTLIAHSRFSVFFQHSESLYVFTWILTMISYLNTSILIAIRCLKKITKSSTGKVFIFPVSILIFIISCIPQNQIRVQQFEDFLYQYYAPILFLFFPVILSIANKKYKKAKMLNNDTT